MPAKKKTTKHRVPRTRGAGTLTEAQHRGKIVSALRQLSRWWKPVNVAKGKARVSKGLYLCAKCNEVFNGTSVEDGKRKNNVAMDHIEPVVPLTGWDNWDGFIDRLFCEEDGYQCLCPECHHTLTQCQNKIRRENKKGNQIVK